MDVDPGTILATLGQARRFADPKAPQEARMMAARGALPLPPPQIASVLFALTFDPDPEVKSRATESLADLPEHVLTPALSADLHPALLGFFTEQFKEDGGRIETIALNAATADETVVFLATLPFPRVIDIVANNQTRLLRCPEILDSLGNNPLTGQATIDRILQFLGIGQETEEEPEKEVEEEAEEATEETEETETLPDMDDPSDLPEALVEENEEPISEDSEKGKSLHALIQDMTVVEKIKLARFGNQEARGFLIRERNRIVASAAIRSPKLTENEVVAFAKSRNLCDEVMRIIANTREWTKAYPVKLALTSNPKAPLQSAIKFLNHLTDRDLKNISRSREVPGPVSAQARRVLIRKGKA